MATFAQYAMAAAQEALNDAGWTPTREEDREATVCYLLELMHWRLSKLMAVSRVSISAPALAHSTMRTTLRLPSETVYALLCRSTNTFFAHYRR